MVYLSPPDDWLQPPRTLIIATLERSGSNLLADYIGQTNQLGSPREYFSSYALADMYPGRGGDIADRCRLAAEFGRSPNGIQAIKLFPEHFADLGTQIRLSEWFGLPRWIWLRRRDVVGQAISFAIARHTGSYLSTTAQQRAPAYSGEMIAELLGQLCARDARWAAFFARALIRPLEIYYEDLVAAPEETVEAIARHLEVNLAPFTLQAPRIARQATDLNEQWRYRFHVEMGWPDLLEVPEQNKRRPPRIATLTALLSRLFHRGPRTGD